MDLVVNTLTARALFENKINIFGGEQYRPLLHVRDAARAIVESIDKKNVGIFNLSLKNYKIIDIAKIVQNYFPKLEMNLTEIPFQDARNYKVDNKKSYDELNFKAEISVETGVSEVKELLEKKRIKDINDPRYTNQKYLELFTNKINL